MKRILTLALVACFVLSAGFVSAKEMQFVGQFEHTLEWLDNPGLLDSEKAGDSEDDFTALQRIRMYFQYVDSEVLRAVVGFEMDNVWGNPANANFGTDRVAVEVKHAYTDFNVGGVAFRVGLQGLTWPSAVAGNPIFDNDVAGIVTSYKFNDNFALTAGWARLVDANTGSDSATNTLDDEVDTFTVIAPITMDGWSLSPYVIYAKYGKDVGLLTSMQAVNATGTTDNMDAWWAGGAFELTMFDPFVFGADLIYGSVDGDKASQNDMAGWFFAAIATYKMDMVTPSLAFMYGTGDDDDPTDGSEVLPTLASGGGGSSGFGLTHFGFDGAAWTETGGILGGRTDYAAVALIVDDISFLENLTHKLTIAYGMGTSDSDIVKKYGLGGAPYAANRPVLTDEDTFWEVNFDSTYQIYENLSLAGKFGYVSADRDEDVWGTAASDLDDAYKFTVILRYNF
jgi:hypothetical protein